MQPASNSTLMENSNVCENPDTICAFLSMGRRYGVLSLHLWVDAILSPSDRVNITGRFDFLMFITGVPGNTKCDVAP